jgi:hypothetical protein
MVRQDSAFYEKFIETTIAKENGICYDFIIRYGVNSCYKSMLNANNKEAILFAVDFFTIIHDYSTDS